MRGPMRFEECYVPVTESGCWLWTAGCTRGYGAFYIEGRQVKAHRHSWELANGPIPAGMLVCHKCDTRSCCNPSHLFLGTALDNTRDMIAKGRDDFPAGQRHSRTKLTDADVLAIRASGLHSTDVAVKYGISEPAASQILNRKTWAHLADDGTSVPSPPKRHPRGESHRSAKLTAAQALAIYGDSRAHPIIAADFGVSSSLVCQIKKGRVWAHVTGGAA